MSTKINLDYLRDMGAIIKLQNREYTTHQGLLYVAHQQGITSIITELVSWDPDRRQAVFKSTATGERGTFTDYGDADPTNVGKMIANACIRMASTRSVSRCLRLYLGIGMTAYDELPGKEQETPPAIPPLAPEPVMKIDGRTYLNETSKDGSTTSLKEVKPKPLPEWTDKERKTFHARRAEPEIDLGGSVGYEIIKQVCKNLDKPMPKHMDPEQRQGLLKWLADGNGQLHIKDAETIIDYNTHAKGE